MGKPVCCRVKDVSEERDLSSQRKTKPEVLCESLETEKKSLNYGSSDFRERPGKGMDLRQAARPRGAEDAIRF